MLRVQSAFGDVAGSMCQALIAGASRVCFACGQAVAPITCAMLYVAHASWAIASMLGVAALVPVVRTTRYCPPRHRAHFEPSFLFQNGIQ